MENKIAEIRRSKGLPQTELAARCGMRTVALSAMETGKAAASPLAVQRIAGVLRCTPAELTGKGGAERWIKPYRLCRS